MEIPFASRSKFLDRISEAIHQSRARFDASAPIHIPLEAGGYEGTVVVVIRREDRLLFDTDWEARDPTRFPARIKAAATALRDLGYSGSFRITHAQASLTIQPI